MKKTLDKVYSALFSKSLKKSDFYPNYDHNKGMFMKSLVVPMMIISLMISSCGQRGLVGVDSISPAIAPELGKAVFNFCTLDPALIKQDLKFIFTLDISGSNASQNGGTDPDRSKRYDSLVRWLDNRADSDHEFYTLVEFAGNRATVAPSALSGPDAPFVKTNAEFSSVVNQQKGSTADSGGTPYLAWEDTVKSIIEADALKALEEARTNNTELVTSRYVVVVLSDGQPTDDNDPYSQIFFKLEEQIMKLPSDGELGAAITSVNVNTGYYYNSFNQANKDLLEEIAKKGKGDFYQFDTSTGTIDYDKLTRVFFKKVSTTLLDLTLENVNSVWDLESRSLQPDYDGDLLADRWEIILGSDPTKADSDENGITDGAEAKVSIDGYPCKDAQCDPDFAFEFEECDADEIASGTLTDTDNDLIPDCEESVYDTDPFEWDSNGNSIPDHLLHKFSLPSTKRPDDSNPTPPAATVDSDFDSVNNAKEIQLNTSPMIDNSSVPGLKPMQYKVKLVEHRPATQQNCYEVTVDDVNIFFGNDRMRFYVYENEQNNTGRSYLRIFEKRMTKGQVQMSESDLIKFSN